MPKQPIKLISPEWERQPNEGLKAFNAFDAYLALQGDCSLREAWAHYVALRGLKRGVSRAPSKWTEYRETFRWDARVTAWLNEQRRKREKRQEEREIQLEEEQWADRKTLREQALRMLEFGLVEKTLKKEVKIDGRVVRQVYIIKPDKWRKKDAVDMLKLANELGRQAVGKDEKGQQEPDATILITGMPMDEL